MVWNSVFWGQACGVVLSLNIMCENRLWYLVILILSADDFVFRNMQRSFSLDVATKTVITLFLHSWLVTVWIFSRWCKRETSFSCSQCYFISFSVLKNSLIQNFGLLKSSFSSGIFCYFCCFRSILRTLKWVRDRIVAELRECLSVLLCMCKKMYVYCLRAQRKYCAALLWGLNRICYEVVQIWNCTELFELLWGMQLPLTAVCFLHMWLRKSNGTLMC